MNHVAAFLKCSGFSYLLIRKCLEDMIKPVVGTFLKSMLYRPYRKVCKDKNYTVRSGLPLRHARERRSEGTVSFFLFIFPNCFNSLQWVCITFVIKKIIWKIFNVLNQFLMIWENTGTSEKKLEHEIIYTVWSQLQKNAFKIQEGNISKC